MLKAAGISGIIAAISLGLMLTPFIGPPGMCATGQVIALLMFFAGSSAGIILQFSAYEFGTRRIVLRRFPYLVVFRETTSGIEIIAVVHGRRRPGYWRDRLE